MPHHSRAMLRLDVEYPRCNGCSCSPPRRGRLLSPYFSDIIRVASLQCRNWQEILILQRSSVRHPKHLHRHFPHLPAVRPVSYTFTPQVLNWWWSPSFVPKLHKTPKCTLRRTRFSCWYMHVIERRFARFVVFNKIGNFEYRDKRWCYAAANGET